MSKRTEKLVFITVLANLVLIAIVGYALDCYREPVGVLFVTPAGPVAFTHRTHVQHGGDDLQCRSCHHDVKGKVAGAVGHLGAKESPEKSCRACHYDGKETHRNVKEKVHQRRIGAKCVSCHADKPCSFCHSQ